MGQQQLLLIALSVIIVGAAVAVGVNMFQEGSEQAQVDPFYQTGSMVATNFAKALKAPSSMGGLGGDVANLPSGDEARSNLLGVPMAADQTDGLYISGLTALDDVSYDIDGDGTNETIDAMEISFTHVASQYTATCGVLENGDVVWDQTDPFSSLTRPTK